MPMIIARRLLLVAICLFIVGAEALSAELAVCGDSKGYGYYPAAGLRLNEEPEWAEDGISGGKLTLSRSNSGDLDILFADASGRVISTVADGGEVILIDQGKGSLSVLVVYDVSIETYTFLKTATGGEVMWTQNRHSGPIVKAAIFRASCSLVSAPGG